MSYFYSREIPIIRKPIIHTPNYSNSTSPRQWSQSHTANINRVITFYSSVSWRKYFHASKMSDKLIVIYFTASWCTPCRYMAPIIDEFATEYADVEYADVEFHKIDVDELFCVAQEFRVQTMPTFVFVKRGKEIDRVTGARRDELLRKIEKYRD